MHMLTVGLLKQCLEAFMGGMPTCANRPELEGILFDLSRDGELRLARTDGRILFLSIINFGDGAQASFSHKIPPSRTRYFLKTKAIFDLVKRIAPSSDEDEIVLYDSNAQLVFGHMHPKNGFYMAGVYDASFDYPNYEKVFNKASSKDSDYFNFQLVQTLITFLSFFNPDSVLNIPQAKELRLKITKREPVNYDVYAMLAACLP